MRRATAAAVLAVTICGCETRSDEVPEAELEAELDAAVQAWEATQQEVESDHQIIDAWLISWSEKQATAARTTCAGMAECDTTAFLPESRPDTPFGWDGADDYRPAGDWARGVRYWATANGNDVLLYLEEGRVASAYWERPGEPRRTLCRGVEDCN